MHLSMLCIRPNFLLLHLLSHLLQQYWAFFLGSTTVCHKFRRYVILPKMGCGDDALAVKVEAVAFNAIGPDVASDKLTAAGSVAPEPDNKGFTFNEASIINNVQ